MKVIFQLFVKILLTFINFSFYFYLTFKLVISFIYFNLYIQNTNDLFFIIYTLLNIKKPYHSSNHHQYQQKQSLTTLNLQSTTKTNHIPLQTIIGLEMKNYNYNYDAIIDEKENHKQIYNTQNYLKQSISTQSYSKIKSQQNLYILKLQSKALDLLKKLQHQKFQIITLTEQTQKLMKVCDQQKSHLRSVNVDMMKQQYDEELASLEIQKQRMMEVIQSMKDQKQVQRVEKQHRLGQARYENQILSSKIQECLLQKKQLLLLINQKNILKKQYQKTITSQDQNIDQLRNIQRKVVISVKQLQRLKQSLYNQK